MEPDGGLVRIRRVRADPVPVAAAKNDPERLRSQLVEELRGQGVVESPAVADALASVPRERFIPDVLAEHGLEAVYRDQAFVTKTDARGLPLSSSSQPGLMATMLELLDLRPGQRVLEIGAGTGYNAALLAQLVGPRGKVTSIDVDEDLARRARRALTDAGYKASVVVGDGRQGWPDAAPYDRIIVTACADEIPRPWLEQLADGGLLELPLRLDPDRSAIQVIPVFERRGESLRSTALTWGGFMPIHGGDGGWRHPPATLSATHSAAGTHASLVSIAGPALAGLSRSAAGELLGSMLTARQQPRARGLVALNSAHPPLLLIYLLLKIPAARRLALHADGRVGVGVFHRGTRSLAFVSVPSPWMGRPEWRRRRAPWRLDAYAGDAAASELERLLADWEAMQRDGRRTLRITAHGQGDPLRLRFGWSRAAA